MTNFLSNISYTRTGDILEVRISDGNYNPYFKKKARISDKKQMKELVVALKEKGVSFPSTFLQ